MSKKDYVLIAETLRSFQATGLADRELLQTLINEFCFTLGTENPRFNPEKFRQYVLAV